MTNFTGSYVEIASNDDRIRLGNNHENAKDLGNALYIEVGDGYAGFGIEAGKKMIKVLQQNIDAFEERVPREPSFEEKLVALGVGAIVKGNGAGSTYVKLASGLFQQLTGPRIGATFAAWQFFVPNGYTIITGGDK